uniref:Uncharacterized protein n=1 Tax=Setaria viridis TaxID=4556 RepID=A0A4U6T0L9_SETVI|nr:hypothetical protein SEVIR_9G298000v2 [Setaria viridis]
MGRLPGAGAERPPGVFGACLCCCPGAGRGAPSRSLPGVLPGGRRYLHGGGPRDGGWRSDGCVGHGRGSGPCSGFGFPSHSYGAGHRSPGSSGRGGDDGDGRWDGCPRSRGGIGGSGDRGGSICLCSRGGGGSGNGDGDLRPGGPSGGDTGGGSGGARSRNSGRNGGAPLGGCGGGRGDRGGTCPVARVGGSGTVG